jgi:hypothetical protein
MLTLLLLFITVQAGPCGFERNKEVGQLAITSCASVSTQTDCLLTNFLDFVTGNYYPCNWVSSACTAGTTSCLPSCFMNNRVQVSSCHDSGTPPSCSQQYTGVYGNSKLCYGNWDLSCSTVPCDWTCTGLQTLTFSCYGLSQYACPRYHLHSTSTGDVNCAWDPNTAACVEGEPCIKVCNGVFPITACSSLSGVYCGQYYQKVGTLKYDCIANTTSGGCKTTIASQCYYPGHPTCSGTYAGPYGVCSDYTNPTTCNARYMLDIFVSGGTFRKCKYYGNVGCIPDRPCQLP